MNKLVSVIIPTYSRPKNLKRAIDSVLNQTYNNIEIIVVDDNGVNTKEQKETEAIIKEYSLLSNFFYLKHERNMNGSAARNTGIRYSHGEYIAFLDDDDEFLNQKIEVQVNALERLDKSWGGCYCNIDIVGRKKTKTIRNNKSGNLVEDLLLGSAWFNSSTLLLRKDVCLELNGFDESFVRHQDWEFMVRFFRNYKIYLPSKGSLVNKYSYSEHSNIPKSQSFVEIKRKFLQSFKTDIDKCHNRDAIYHKHWMEVVYSLLCDYKYKLFLVYLNRAMLYKKISCCDVKRMIRVFLSSLFKWVSTRFRTRQ